MNSNLIQFFEELENEEDLGDVSNFPTTLEPDLVSVRQIGQRIVQSLQNTLRDISINEAASGRRTIVIDLEPIDIGDVENIIGLSLTVQPMESSEKQVLAGRLTAYLEHSRDL